MSSRPIANPAELPDSLRGVRSLTFDLMGTCLDWLTNVQARLEDAPALSADRSINMRSLAMCWRQGFFDEILRAWKAGEAVKDKDVVHDLILRRLLKEHSVDGIWSDDVIRDLLDSWHTQYAWQDTAPGLAQLKERFDVVVLANGTTRLQLDLMHTSGLSFHTMFSSQLLGYTKPDPRVYVRALEILQRRPEQVAMVAAHAYDLRAAKKVGLRTIYIHRDTEDPLESEDNLRTEFDLYIDGRNAAGARGGLVHLGEMLRSARGA